MKGRSDSDKRAEDDAGGVRADWRREASPWRNRANKYCAEENRGGLNVKTTNTVSQHECPTPASEVHEASHAPATRALFFSRLKVNLSLSHTHAL